jgi:chemotaxis protein CheD
MRHIVGVADMKVSNNPAESVITYSLGSCIGLVVYDPTVRVGGILHYMLPESSIDREKAAARPFMFADTGIPILFKSAYQLGAVKSRIRIYVAGGAEILDQKGFFNTGLDHIHAHPPARYIGDPLRR